MLDWPVKALCRCWLASCDAPTPDCWLQGQQLVCPHRASQSLQAACWLTAVVQALTCPAGSVTRSQKSLC